MSQSFLFCGSCEFFPFLPCRATECYSPAVRRIYRLVPALFAVSILTSCTGRSTPEVLAKPPVSFDTQQEIAKLARLPGVQPDTLWRIEAEYLDEQGKSLSKNRVDVVLTFGEWQSELAPIQITPGYRYLRENGELGDGPPDMFALLQLAPAPLNMRMTQRIVPVNQTEPLPQPSGAQVLHARLLEVCPLEIRYMKQVNRRSAGDVIPLRTVREEMHWREYRISGACRKFQ